MKIPVSRYGFHLDDNIVFLHEQTKTRCLTPGLQGLDSPFEVIRAEKTQCPHNIHTPMRAEIPDDLHPLIKAMAPLPSEGKAYHVPLDHKYILAHMYLMVGGVQQRMFVPWTMTRPADRLLPQLTVTNAAPIVISDYEYRHIPLINKILRAPRNRTVILCGPLRLGDAESLPPMDLTKNYDWETLGAALLEKYINDLIA